MNLKDYRFIKRISQEEMAKMIGVSDASISRYENGKVKEGIVKDKIESFLDSVEKIKKIDYEADGTIQTNQHKKSNADIQEQEIQEQYINLLLKKALDSVDFSEKKLIINKIISIVNL